MWDGPPYFLVHKSLCWTGIARRKTSVDNGSGSHQVCGRGSTAFLCEGSGRVECRGGAETEREIWR